MCRGWRWSLFGLFRLLTGAAAAAPSRPIYKNNLFKLIKKFCKRNKHKFAILTFVIHFNRFIDFNFQMTQWNQYGHLITFTVYSQFAQFIKKPNKNLLFFSLFSLFCYLLRNFLSSYVLTQSLSSDWRDLSKVLNVCLVHGGKFEF